MINTRMSQSLPLAAAALIALVATIPTRAASDTDSEKSAATSTGNGASTKASLHISPQAMTGPKPPKIAPPTPEEIDSAIHRGIKFLLADQRPDGSWGSP